ncbi:MAG: S8 family serine peptidase [Gemmatimonadota bacterium]
MKYDGTQRPRTSLRMGEMRILVSALTFGFAMSCVDLTSPPNAAMVPGVANTSRLDGLSGGTLGFYFVTPIQANQPVYFGQFDPTRSPTIEICKWVNGACEGPLVASYSGSAITVSTSGKYYRADWPVMTIPRDALYRIRVLENGVQLGFTDAQWVPSGMTPAMLMAQRIVPLGNASYLSIRFRLTIETPVPAIAPDTVPVGYDNFSRAITETARWYGDVLPDVAVVIFKPNTTQVQKQAAIDRMGGVVIGGRRVTGHDGVYLIRVPSDGTTGNLFNMLDTLKTLPVISVAIPEQLFTEATTYVRPNDGPSFAKNLWRLNPDSAFGSSSRRTWALEAINAPMAWGCSTGGTTKIEVIDMGHHRVGDIVANVDTSNNLPGYAFSHGTRVSSVIAAKGNNASGMTGVMWDAKLNLQDVSVDSAGNYSFVGGTVKGEPRMNGSTMLKTLFDIGTTGARVVNISLGQRGVHAGPPSAGANKARADYGHAAAEAVSSVPTASHPLWVISAGNMYNASNAGWAPTTGIADSLPFESLLVTGASFNSGALLTEATGTGNIDVAAPGEDVAVDDANGITAQSGSSFGTAMVSGTAGLLFSWDSTLTATQAQLYILAGAQAGGRTAGGYPLLDAYQALRSAARHSGRPLCGNRVYNSGNKIVVDRGTVRDTIGPAPEGFRGINVKHGGHRIEVYARPTSVAFTFANGQWTSSTTAFFPPTAPNDGGAYNGVEQLMHDGDTLVMPRYFRDTTKLFVMDTISYSETKIGSNYIHTPMPTTAMVGSCDYERLNGTSGQWECIHSQYYHGEEQTRLISVDAVASAQRSSFVAFAYFTTKDTGAVPAMSDCEVPGPLPETGHCRERRFYLFTHDSLQLYDISLNTGALHYLGSLVGARANQMVVSEDGSELVLGYEKLPAGIPSSEITTGSGAIEVSRPPAAITCVVASIPITRSAGAISLGVWTELSRTSALDRCIIAGAAMGPPTFAPRRTPVAPGLKPRVFPRQH